MKLNGSKLILTMVLISAPVVLRAENGNEDLNQYLKRVSVQLEHTAQRANQPSATGSSVIGVRGSKQVASSKELYWKGKPTTPALVPEEVKLFRQGVEEARAGRKDEAVTLLKSFEEKYPKSALLPDVQETLKRLQTN